MDNNIISFDEIKKKIDDIVEVEKLLNEMLYSLLNGMFFSVKLRINIRNRIDALTLREVETNEDYTDIKEFLISKLYSTDTTVESAESDIQKIRETLKAIAQSKRESGISSNNTFQPKILNWDV